MTKYLDFNFLLDFSALENRQKSRAWFSTVFLKTTTLWRHTARTHHGRARARVAGEVDDHDLRAAAERQVGGVLNGGQGVAGLAGGAHLHGLQVLGNGVLRAQRRKTTAGVRLGEGREI